MMTAPVRITTTALFAAFLAVSLSSIAISEPKHGPPGGGGRGGAPHVGGAPHPGGGGGPRIGGAPHMGGGAPHVGGPRFGAMPGGARMAVPHAAPRMAMPHGGPRIGMRAGPARPFAASRPHFAPRARFAGRPAFHGRAMTPRGSFAARGFNRPVPRSELRSLSQSRLDRRALGRNVGRGAVLSDRAAARTLRSAPVRAQADARNAAFARRAFSGRNAQTQAARLFRDPAFLRHRFDPAFHGRVRFAGAFWPGPFFWPYAYYDEAFWLWPSAYDEVFWTYGYDDLARGIYGPYAFSDYDSFLEAVAPPVRRARGYSSAPRSFAELCGDAAPGLTDWPADDIAAAVEPNEQQRALLDALIRASDKAAENLRAACPRLVSVTPIGRLEALEKQLAALGQAVQTVRPALEKFYASLSDEQKERFNALGPASRSQSRRARDMTAPQPDRLARACQEAASASDDPINRIERAVQPNDRQRAALEEFRSATAQAARIVQSACPTDLPLTPTGRLAAMESRIDALRQATETLRPALAKFYASLNDEQKARFNRAFSNERRMG